MTQSSAGWRQKFFAWMMANAAQDYENNMALRKAQLFATVSGQVLELGPGAGPNFTYFSSDIQWIGLEPNPFMLPYLKNNAEQWGGPIDLRETSLESAQILDNSIDVVISTLVLCSVPNLNQTLDSILRVLRPEGQFLFLEHVAAPEGSLLRAVQNGIRPVWAWIGDGCQTNRETGVEIQKTGFSSVHYEEFEGPVPIAIVRPHLCGVAIK